MKTLKRTALLLLTVGFTNASLLLAKDADRPDVRISVRQIKTDQKKAFIRITHLPEQQAAVLRIKDMRGYTLHRELVNPCQVYAKKYDFSQLPNGEYVVELKTNNGTITESFVLEAKQTTSLYFKPAIQQVEGLIKVSFLNSIDSPIVLKLYDETGDVLYEEIVDSQERFAKALDVSQLKAGKYSLSLMSPQFVYAKSILVP